MSRWSSAPGICGGSPHRRTSTLSSSDVADRCRLVREVRQHRREHLELLVGVLQLRFERVDLRLERLAPARAAARAPRRRARRSACRCRFCSCFMSSTLWTISRRRASAASTSSSSGRRRGARARSRTASGLVAQQLEVEHGAYSARRATARAARAARRPSRPTARGYEPSVFSFATCGRAPRSPRRRPGRRRGPRGR